MPATREAPTSISNLPMACCHFLENQITSPPALHFAPTHGCGLRKLISLIVWERSPDQRLRHRPCLPLFTTITCCEQGSTTNLRVHSQRVQLLITMPPCRTPSLSIWKIQKQLQLIFY